MTRRAPMYHIGCVPGVSKSAKASTHFMDGGSINTSVRSTIRFSYFVFVADVIYPPLVRTQSGGKAETLHAKRRETMYLLLTYALPSATEMTAQIPII